MIKRNPELCIAIIWVLVGVVLAFIDFSEKSDGYTPENNTDTQITTEVTTTSTTTPVTTKVSETTVKTTQKAVNRSQVKTFDIKASKEEIITEAKRQVLNKWGIDEWEPFYQIVLHESNWNPNDINKASGACGLFQMHPCSKTNAQYKVSYVAQIETGINYIATRYKTPSKAWEFWLKHKWY